MRRLNWDKSHKSEIFIGFEQKEGYGTMKTKLPTLQTQQDPPAYLQDRAPWTT